MKEPGFGFGQDLPLDQAFEPGSDAFGVFRGDAGAQGPAD